MATEQQHTDDTGAPQGGDELQKKIDEFLADPATRTALLQKLSGHTPTQDSRTRDGAAQFPYPTLSGTSVGSGWPVFPMPFPLTPAPGFPPFGVSMLTPPWHNQHFNVLVKPMQLALAPQEMTRPLTMRYY